MTTSTFTSFRSRRTFKSSVKFKALGIVVILSSIAAGFSLPAFAGDAVLANKGNPMSLNQPIVGLETKPTGKGYWLVASDGGIFAYGGAHFYGSTGGKRLNKPIVGMASTPNGNGYWLVASDGGVFSFGNARFRGSTGSLRLNKPIVGMESTPSGNGYWLVASDGGIFAFGDAEFYGSTGGKRLNKPIVGMATTNTGRGYWLVASDGGIFSFGKAGYYGSTGGKRLGTSIVGMNRSKAGKGYWLAAADGGIYSFGDARFWGAIGGGCIGSSIVGMSSNPNLSGYYIATQDGQVRAFSNSQSTNCKKELARQTPCWGNSADKKVVISISKQRLWACQKSSTVLVSPITTGAFHNGGTPQGNFAVYSKQTNRYLTGPGYRAHVNFWMPFLRGYGMHDASWRSQFGGSDYGRIGSHGCVNMPFDKAQSLYHWVNVGTPVHVTG